MSIKVAKIFDEKGGLADLKVPKGMIVQTVYKPEKGENIVPQFAHLSAIVTAQEKTNDPAVIIVCAPIDTTSKMANRYFVSTQNTLNAVGMGDRATVQKRCNAERDKYRSMQRLEKKKRSVLYSLVA